MKLRSLVAFVALLQVTCASAQVLNAPTAVFIMKADGSDVHKVAQVDGYFDHGSPRWSHDGKRLAFQASLGRGGPRACFVVNVDGTGLAHMCKGRVPDWSPDDKQIVFQSDGSGEIYAQNPDGKSRVEIAEGRGPRWSPDGGRLALTDRRILRVKDLVTGEETALFDQPQHEVFDGFTWSPDGKQIAVVTRAAEGEPRQLLILDASGNNETLKPRLKNEMGGFISYSPDGRQIVFSDSWQIQVVDVEGNAPPRKLPGQDGMSRHPAYSPDGKWIAFVSTRQSPEPAAPKKGAQLQRAWKLEEVKRHRKGTIVYGLAFTPDGNRLILGCDPQNKGVQVWDIDSDETWNLGGQGIRIKMFPDGRRFATSWHSPLVQIIDVDSGKVLREMDHGARMWVLSVSPDGRRVLTGGLDKVMRVWDPDTGEQLHAYANLHNDWITRARFSPDAREAITISHDRTLAVWNVETGKERLRIKHPAAVWGLAVTPDGRHILTGTGGSLQSSLTVLNIGKGPDNVVRMWDAESGELVREMMGHEHAVYAIDVSPDGRLAASGDWDGTLRLWDLETGAEVSKIGPGQGRVPFVSFSPNGKWLAVGGGARRVDRRIVEFPDEQLRLYKLVETSGPAAKAQAP